MSRAKNDATLSKLGDIYQHYVALLDCFSMKPGDKIQIEVNGDISKIAKINTSSFQKEVKHHVSDNYLSDRDIDFWKTLKNWICDFERVDCFSELILFTTVNIAEGSMFNNWNKNKITEKITAIKNVGGTHKPNEEGFRKLYDEIEANRGKNDDRLKAILKKLKIQHLQPKISGISEDFTNHVKHIPMDRRDAYIASLLGAVISKVKDEPFIWEVSYEEFVALLQAETARYCNINTVPLPEQFADATPAAEVVDVHKGKKYVEEIKKIEYEKMIPKAIRDYWRMNMTVTSYFTDNPVYNRDLPKYIDTLKDKLFYAKEQKIIENVKGDRKKQISESQILYSVAMQWDAIDFGSVRPNQAFFQRGVLHDIIDDGEITWDVGENDEH